MVLTSVWWIFLTILLNILCLSSSKIIPGTIKVSVETCRKICTTVYGRQKISSTILETPGANSHLYSYHCFGPNCSSAQAPNESIILRSCQDLRTSQLLKLDPKVYFIPQSKYNKYTEFLQPLLSDLEAMMSSIDPSVQKVNNGGPVTSKFLIDLDRFVTNLVATLNGLNIDDPVQSQQNIIKVINSLTPESFVQPQRETVLPPIMNSWDDTLDPMMKHVKWTLNKLDEITNSLLPLLALNHTGGSGENPSSAPHVGQLILNLPPQLNATAGIDGHDMSQLIKYLASLNVPAAGDAIDTDLWIKKIVNVLESLVKPITEAHQPAHYNQVLNRVDLALQKLDEITKNLSALVVTHPAGMDQLHKINISSVPTSDQPPIDPLDQLINGFTTSQNLLPPSPQQQKFDYDLIIKKLHVTMLNVKRIIVDIAALEILNNTDVDNKIKINGQIPLIMEDLSSILQKTVLGSYNEQQTYTLIGSIQLVLERLALTINDLETILTLDIQGFHPAELEDEIEKLSKFTDSLVVPTPPITYNLREIIPLLIKKVPDHDLMILVKEFLEISKHFKEISNVPPLPAADIKTDLELDNFLSKLNDLEGNEIDSAVSYTSNQLELPSSPEDILHKIPYLITILETTEIEVKFWKPVYGNTNRESETLKTLAEILEFVEKAAQNPEGYHRVSRTIVVLLRIQVEELLDNDLMEYIEYLYYSILAKNPDASMKSGDSYVLERKSEMLPGGENLTPIKILIETIKSTIFQDVYWIPENGGIEKMPSTIATLAEIFLEGGNAVIPIDDLTQIMCIMITLQDTGLINVKQAELDGMIRSLFPILESMMSKETDQRVGSAPWAINVAHGGAPSGSHDLLQLVR